MIKITTKIKPDYASLEGTILEMINNEPLDETMLHIIERAYGHWTALFVLESFCTRLK